MPGAPEGLFGSFGAVLWDFSGPTMNKNGALLGLLGNYKRSVSNTARYNWVQRALYELQKD